MTFKWICTFLHEVRGRSPLFVRFLPFFATFSIRRYLVRRLIRPWSVGVCAIFAATCSITSAFTLKTSTICLPLSQNVCTTFLVLIHPTSAAFSPWNRHYCLRKRRKVPTVTFPGIIPLILTWLSLNFNFIISITYSETTVTQQKKLWASKRKCVRVWGVLFNILLYEFL